MRQAFILLFISTFLTVSYSQNTIIPDILFEQELINSGYDNILDGQVTTANINTITVLNIPTGNITDLSGIQDFTSLRTLRCTGNMITTLDLTNLSSLEDLNVSNNLITSLLLPNSIIEVNAANNQLTGIDLSTHNNLIELNIEENQFTSFNSGVADLEILNLSQNQLSTLNLPILSSLTDLDLSNNLFTSLDFSNNLALTDLTLSNNALTALDISLNIQLELLRAANCTLNSLDLSLNTALVRVLINGNQLSTIDLFSNLALEEINIGANPITSVGMGSKPVLEKFSADNCDITNIDFTQAPLLEYIGFESNQLTTVDLSQNPVLNRCWIRRNNLINMDFSNNPLMRSINLSTNQLTSLTPPPSTTTLTYFAMGGNLLSDPAILNSFNTYPNLSIVDIGNNNFSGTLPNLTGLPSLSYYIFSNNSFQFGDFENEHIYYRDNISVSPFYSNEPQEKINTIDIINANTGGNVTMTTTASGAQNHYEWFKDGNSIAGAPDNDTYIITNLQSTDAGIYHCEVSSDIVVSPNNGQQLVLERNEITLIINSFVPNCTSIISPADNDIDVTIDTNIDWNTEATATGYLLSIGTTTGATDILNNFDNGNSTSYNPPMDFLEDTTYYVTITPYNTAGNATGCTETSFTTETLPVGCPNPVSILNNQINVSLDETITWFPAFNADSYLIFIGTGLPGASNIFSGTINNATFLSLMSDLPANTLILVEIQAFNSISGESGCINGFSFTTAEAIPNCATLISPTDNDIDVTLDTNIDWNAEAIATGYLLSIGTTPGTTDILNNFDNGNSTSYNPPMDFLEDTTYYVTITPYNTAGNATGCMETSFTTEIITSAPNCNSIISPADNDIDVALDTNIDWNTEATATGYLLSIGTTPGATDILNNFDNGNSTFYNPPVDFLEGTDYFVTITPYNAVGNATGCNETNFTTEIIPTAPNCTSIISPADDAENIPINMPISWNFSPNSTGYFISIGTTIGGNEIVDNFDNGNDVTYNHPQSYPDNTTLYVTIIPYNNIGNAINCNITSFTTANLELIIPKYFTPNQDGFHDNWLIEDPTSKIATVSIFDRYGKLIKKIDRAPFLWDGLFNSQELVSSDYWHQITLLDGKTLSGHFTLKR